MTTEKPGGRGHPFLLGIMAGGAIGAGLAFLLAPRLRAEVRERVENSAEAFRKKATAVRDEACDAVIHAAKEVERRAAEAKTH